MKNENRKSNIFWYAYALLCVVLVLTIITVTALLYNYIEAFEVFRPEHSVEEYIKTLDAEKLAKLASPRVAELTSGFEADGAVLAEVHKTLSNGELSYVEAVGNIDGGESHVFDIYCGEKLATVTLVECSGGKYGFKNYTVGDAVITDEWITSRLTTVSVITPAGCDVIINNRGVADSYIVGTAEAGEAITEFERGDGFGFELMIYEIPNVFGAVEARALGRDGEIALGNPTAGVYTSDYTATDSALTFTAPTEAVVTLNGIVVSDAYITDEVTASDATVYEAKTAPKCSVYTVKGLHHAPAIEVTLDGEALEYITLDDHTIAYTYPDSYKKSYTVRLPEGITLYCNGVAVPESSIVSDDGEYSVPDAVKRYVKTEKTCVEYAIDGLYGTPEFTSSDENCVVDTVNGVHTFYPAPSKSETDRLYDEALNFTKLYVKYSYEGSKYTDANYNAVIAHVKEGSDAYDIIEVSYNSMIFNSNFKVDKLETEIYDMVKYADNCYGIKVDFDSHGKYYKYEKVSVGTYTMIWIVSDGQWQLAYFKFV